jgi:hypothetical protein
MGHSEVHQAEIQAPIRVETDLALQPANFEFTFREHGFDSFSPVERGIWAGPALGVFSESRPLPQSMPLASQRGLEMPLLGGRQHGVYLPVLYRAGDAAESLRRVVLGDQQELIQ